MREPSCSEPTKRAGWGRQPLIVFGWYLFLSLPIADLLSSDPSPPRSVAVLAAVAAFVVIGATMWRRPPGTDAGRSLYVAIAANLVIASVLTVADRPSWGLLFVFLAPVTARLPERVARPYLVLLVALTVGLTSVEGDAAAAISFGASCLGVGFLLLNLGRLARANQELREARAELAELAVADERLRFSRDLHDLLGHGLSVIAIKAELAGRLLPDRPEEARRHVAELEAVARDGLVQVRQAVSGYRRPTLASELVGARMALEAADIEAQIEEPGVRLPPDVEAALAWTVREGTTNVLRHSGARHVHIRVVAGLTEIVAEVIDDGRGGDGPDGDGGHGLSGLRERAAALGGDLVAGPAPGGGFSLRMAIPRPRGREAPEPEERATSAAAAAHEP
jgi:two-component system sensor histidine kinase DesK